MQNVAGQRVIHFDLAFSLKACADPQNWRALPRSLQKKGSASNEFAMSRPNSTISDSSLKTRLAFHIWRALLLVSLGTFALGLLVHIVTLLAAPWLTLRTEASIQAAIPVVLTVVKFVTVPLLLLLTPFARRHPTFASWESWSKANLHKLERIVKIPWNTAKSLFFRAKSLF